MKIVIDTLGCPATSGGMRAVASLVLSLWAEEHPQDDLVVLGNPWVQEEFGAHPRIAVHVRPEGGLPRVWGQWVGAGVLARRERATALLSLSPVVSPLFSSSHRFCVAHDWRHLHRPEEFSAGQRLYRRTWRYSAQNAGAVIAISAKSAAETHVFAPRAEVVLIEHGRDQVLRWPAGGPIRDDRPVLTFGHHTNKRPDLVVRAVVALAQETRPPLVVLGAAGSLAAALRDLATDLGVEVELPGFVDEPTYRGLVRSAGVVVLASSDEGFGLPVTEAEQVGIPVVTTDDNGLADLHPDLIVRSADPSALADGLHEAMERRPGGIPVEPVRTWSEAVADYRRTVAGLSEGRHDR